MKMKRPLCFYVLNTQPLIIISHLPCLKIEWMTKSSHSKFIEDESDAASINEDETRWRFFWCVVCNPILMSVNRFKVHHYVLLIFGVVFCFRYGNATKTKIDAVRSTRNLLVDWAHTTQPQNVVWFIHRTREKIMNCIVDWCEYVWIFWMGWK